MIIPRPASTVALVRDHDTDGLQVYLLRRNAGMTFVPGATVFPGGAVDDADHDPAVARWCHGRSETDASLVLGYPPGALAWWIAAVRETYEEVGVLLARPAGGRSARIDREQMAACRHDVLGGRMTLAQACAELDVQLDLGTLRYFGHWVTPHESPQRYDTRFFVAPVPPGQVPEPDRGEAVEGWWSTPAAALEAAEAGAIELILPTMVTLGVVSRFERLAELLAVLDAHGAEPRTVATDFGRRVALPDDL